jgi:hypothetical protein
LKIIIVLLAFFLSVTAVKAEQDGVLIHDGFLTGNDYLELDSGGRNGYVMGLIDGIYISPFFWEGGSYLSTLSDCLTEGVTNGQLVAIFDKYLQENPVRWNQGMHVIAYAALKESCKSLGRY